MHFLIWETLSFNLMYVAACYPVGTTISKTSSLFTALHHIVTHTGTHRVTSSNIYQIKAQSLGSSKLHEATVRTEGEFFTALQQRVPLIPYSKALTDKCIKCAAVYS